MLLVGDRRVLFTVTTSEMEHRLVTTNPVDLSQQVAPTKMIDLSEADTDPLSQASRG